MAARTIAALVALACLTGCAIAPAPKASSPSRLEKSCPAGPFYVPCFIMDEATGQQWDI